MPTSTAIKVQQDGSVIFADGTTTPVTLTVPYVDGAASIDGLDYDQTEPIVVFAKRTFLGVRRGAHRPLTFSFTAYMSEFSSATATSLLDFVRFTNGYSSNESTSSTEFDFKTIKVTLESAAIGSDGSASSVAMDDCVVEVSYSEGEPNQFTVSGTCYGAVTVT